MIEFGPKMAEGGSVSSTANNTYEEPNTAVIHGKRYRTVTIDGKVWMAENYAAPVGIPNPKGMPVSMARWDYADSVLYNAPVVRWLASSPPAGWHIPSYSEWKALFAAVGGESVAGGKLKSTSGWTEQNGTDDYGFNGKPCGYRVGVESGVEGDVINKGSGTSAYWWHLTFGTAYFYNDSTGAGVSEGRGADPYWAHSIRLVKD